MKSTSRASIEFLIPKTTVWCVLKNRFHKKPYKLQLLCALHPNDYSKRYEVCGDMANKGFPEHLVFLMKVHFKRLVKLGPNRHNIQIWGTENPRLVVQHEGDSPKSNVFCAMSSVKVYGPFSFAEKSMTCIAYLDPLEHWLFPQLLQDMDDIIFIQNGAPPHFHRDVHTFLNKTV